MALPWKLFARWLPPRREEIKTVCGSGAQPETVLLPPPTERSQDNKSDPFSTTVVGEHDVEVQAVASSADAQPDNARDRSREEAGVVDNPAAAGLVPPELLDTGLIEVPGVPAADAAPKVRTDRRSKKNALAPIVTKVAPLAAEPVKTLTLDQEINLLRRQLAIKLRLQNAQLALMLERFGK